MAKKNENVIAMPAPPKRARRTPEREAIARSLAGGGTRSAKTQAPDDTGFTPQVVRDSNAVTHSGLQRAVDRVTIAGVEKRKLPDPDYEMRGTTTAEMSTAIPPDPLSSLAARGEIIEPPFDLFTLALLGEHNTELGPCVESMEVNIDGFGYRLVPRKNYDAPDVQETVRTAALEERVMLENFFEHAGVDDSFTVLRRKLRKDLEYTGNAYAEIVRGMKGEIQYFVHIPSYHMRLGRVEERPYLVEVPALEKQVDGTHKLVKQRVWKRFRKYAQSRATYLRNLSALGGYKTVWFKEYGDPRVYDNKTGYRIDDPEQIAQLPPDERANEIIHFKIYSSRTPYGLPRFIGNLLSIFGDRAAEEINYITFRNNNIPSMAVLVSNGMLTQETCERIKTFTESQIQGSDNWSKWLLIEAEGATEGEDGGQMKVEIKPLTEQQQGDALFQNYSASNREKTRRAFRIPSLLLGGSNDHDRATAETARRLADEQVFSPERDNFDDWISRRLFPDLGAVYHTFKTNSPPTTDNVQLVRILAEAEKSGGMTPRIARRILEEILNRDLPDFPPDFPVDVPFSMTMAEAVKNKAQANEPGQQVTALKILKALGLFDGGSTEDSIEEVLGAKDVQRASASIEKRWSEEVEGR